MSAHNVFYFWFLGQMMRVCVHCVLFRAKNLNTNRTHHYKIIILFSHYYNKTRNKRPLCIYLNRNSVE